MSGGTKGGMNGSSQPVAGAPRLLLVDDEPPARQRLRTVLSDIAADFPHAVVGEAADGMAALNFLAETGADIVLVDVQMPGMDGIEFARHAAQLEVPPAIVFVTAFDAYALKAFEVHALDFLVKPVRAQRLLESLQRVADLKPPRSSELTEVARAATPGGRAFISVHERGRVLLVPVTEILYFKAELKYVTIRTSERQYLTEESLVALEDEFAESFVRVHRNALVAKNAISGFERVEGDSDEEGAGEPHWEVTVRGVADRLPVSRRQWPVVKAILRR